MTIIEDSHPTGERVRTPFARETEMMCTPLLRPLLLAAALCCGSQSLAAEPPAESRQSHHDLLLFPDVTGAHAIDGPSPDDDVLLGVNILYSYTAPRLRALAEYAISNDENEVERLQLGWAFSDRLLTWAGRVHNPDNYWNTTFHHGQYLQTSISRPWISRFEDEGGPLLAHTTGVLIESEHHNQTGGSWNAYLSLGVGAHLEDNLEPFDIFSPASDHGFASHGRLAYLPDFLGQNQIGVVASYNDFSGVRSPSDQSADIAKINQFSLGAYADWQWGGTRLLSEYRYVHNRLGSPLSRSEHFTSFYAYLEQKLADRWTAYGRMDLIGGERSSVYLELLDETISEQWMAGLRWDFARRHALKLELQHERFPALDDRLCLQLQWSAVLP